MTEPQLVQLACLADIVALAILIYVVGRSRIRTNIEAYKVRLTLQLLLFGIYVIERSLRNQRRALNDAHRRICAVTKGVEKAPE